MYKRTSIVPDPTCTIRGLPAPLGNVTRERDEHDRLRKMNKYYGKHETKSVQCGALTSRRKQPMARGE